MAKIPTLIDIIGVQGSRDTGELLSWPLKLDIEQSSIVLNPCLILSSSVSVSSPASLNSQCSPTMSWFEWLIYLVYGKHYHHLMMLWQILLSRPLYIHYKRWDEISYPFLNLNGTTVHACTCMYKIVHLPICEFHHQVSGLHWWFFDQPQTSISTSC